MPYESTDFKLPFNGFSSLLSTIDGLYSDNGNHLVVDERPSPEKKPTNLIQQFFSSKDLSRFYVSHSALESDPVATIARMKALLTDGGCVILTGAWTDTSIRTARCTGWIYTKRRFY